MSWRVRLLRGDEAAARLADPGFVRDWHALAEQDPKHHWFQQPLYCTAWYREYGKRHMPLLAIAEDRGGLRGLMPLATRDGKVAHAGAHQCEYEGWIADRGIDAEFGRRAVAEVLRQGGIPRWQWRYVAPGTPREWLEDPGSPHLVETFAAPLLDAGNADFLADRERGRLRSYRNRLRKRGLRYVRVTEIAAARELLSRLAVWCDLRQAAAHATLPFADDPAKLPFHEALLQDPGQVWLSALYLEDRPIAAHMGFLHDGELAVGIQGYDPAESRTSPGALLLLDVAGDLGASGGTTLDLTPGGDPWKERYASHHRPIARLVIHRTQSTALSERARCLARTSARSVLLKLGARRVLEAIDAAPPAPVVSADAVPAAELPGPTTRFEDDAQVVEAALHEQAVALGADGAERWLQEAFRRLGAGWRAAVGQDGDGATTLLWAAPADVLIDISDPAAPVALQEPRDRAILVVRADAAGSIPPRRGVGAVLAAALACWNEAPQSLWVLSDAEAAAVRGWLAGERDDLRQAS